MAHIVITGSADGLGRAAAETLLGDGQRSSSTPAAPSDWPTSTRSSTGARRRGRRPRRPRPDPGGGRSGRPARAGRRGDPQRGRPQRPALLPVNLIAPYLLTASIRPQRLVYLSSGMHHGGRPTVAGLDWSGTAPPPRTPTASCSSPRLPSLWPGCGPTCTATRSTPAGCRPGWAAPEPPTTSGWDT